ncbi:MAG: CoA transferase [Candidatus Thermoplasmatota archaeon]|jgi:crotonobetainyl-CoA:carnitine CoA-transferase CaiB-like acyl-CoA transferase|nr:CoA transferase [Candidatus Thermoplasmatota archaeon]
MVRVIEVGHIVAGPTAGLILADLGHEVIKIENPDGGDIARKLEGSSKGAFPTFNRNKKSVAIDLKKPEGREVFNDIVKTSDILIDNLSNGTMDSLGLGFDNLKKLRHNLIYLSIHGYGPGPLQNRKSLDFPIEVHSGMAFMNGLKGRPLRVGASVVDIASALFGVVGALDALSKRRESDKAKKIEIGLFETAMFLVGQHIVTEEMLGKELDPINESGFAWGIYDFFDTKDGKKIFIAVTTDNQWKKFCLSFNIGFCDERIYEHNDGRYLNRDTLIPRIAENIKCLNSSDVIGILEQNNIVFSILKKPWDLLQDDQSKDKFVRVDYIGEMLRVPSTPVNETGYTGTVPNLGEDTDTVLRSLGYPQEKIDHLRKTRTLL